MSLNIVNFNGRGPTIVFLHGLGATTRYWSSMLDFTKAGREVILIDLLGFGDSPKPYIQYTLERHLHALVPELNAKNEMILVGHSLGAILSLAYAKRFPHKVLRLVLLGLPVFDGMNFARKWFNHRPGGWVYTNYLAMMITCIFTRHIAAKFLPLIVKSYPKEIVQDLVKHNVMSSTTTLWNVIYKQNFEWAKIDLPDRLRVFCIHAEDDDLAPFDRMASLVALHEWQLHRFDGTGHHAWLHNPERCWEIISAE